MQPPSNASALNDCVLSPVRVEALQRGDSAVLESVLHELLPFVRGLLHRMLGPGANLDDAVQDALIDLASALRRYESRASLKTYAGRVVVRVGYRYFKKRAHDGRHEEFSDETCSETERTPEGDSMARQVVARLYGCLDALPDKHRMAFVLCDVEGMQPAEAAALMRIHPITMRSHLRRARKGLRSTLQQDPELYQWLAEVPC